MLPNFLVDDEEVLAIGFGDLHLADVGEIRNGGLKPSWRAGYKQQQRQGGSEFHAPGTVPSVLG
jgi:hypothetical protein